MACAFALACSCSLTIDTDGLSGGPEELECPDSQKKCEVDGLVECVDLDDPAFGCGRISCVPCYLEHARAICSPASGQCVIGNCIGSWEDCDRADSNGCEADLNTDTDHCGSCNFSCEPLPHAEDVRCGSASCYVRICDAGFANCNGDESDGCETEVDSEDQLCDSRP